MIINNTTWKSFIANHHASAWLDGNLAAISTAFSPTKSEIELIETALGVDPNIFLILPSDTMHPTMVHHVSKAPRNALLTDDSDEYFCLLGWEQTATAIKVNPDLFFAPTHEGEIDMATARRNGSKVRKVCTRRLRSPINKKEFSQCPLVPDEVTTVRKCIPLSPAIAEVLLNATALDPHQMGHDLARLVFDIENDRSHKLNKAVSSQAGKEAIDEILTWLYFAPRYPSLRLDCQAAIPGSKVFKACQELHRAKLSPHGTSSTVSRHTATGVDLNSGMTNEIIGTIERNTAAIQQLAETRRDLENDRNPGSNDKGFAKLPEDVQNFLLAVALDDLESPASAIAKPGLDLLKLNQKNSITALSRLLSKQDRGFGNMSIAQSNDVVSLQWFTQSTPFAGLSTCRMLPEAKSTFSLSALEKVTKLELLQKLEIDKESVLETLTDKSLHKPPSLDNVMRNLSTVQGILEIYLGIQCAVVQRISEFKQDIRANRRELVFKAAADDQLLTKMQYIFDSRLNSWMEKMYANADSIQDVPHELIDFSSIIQGITFGHFAVVLPAGLTPASNKNKRSAPEDDDSSERSDHQDNRGTREKQARRAAINQDQNPKWKLQDGESWETFNKDPNNLRPKTVCLMYHILGQCPLGQKCRRAKSHGRLTNETHIKQTTAFVEDCRKNQKP
jgi:hypothetical protein